VQAAKPTPPPRHRLRASGPSASSQSLINRYPDMFRLSGSRPYSSAASAFDASDDAASAAPSLANPASAWGVSDACEAPPQLDDELSSA